MTAARLPTGRPGQALAVVLLLLLLALAWESVGSPLVAVYADRDAALDGRRALATRMEALAAALPTLRAAAAKRGAVDAASVPVLAGATDAVAGAALQQKLGDMAGRAGVTLATAELLPAEPAGAYRRVRLRVTVQAPWSNLVAMLDAIASAQPGMVVDDVQIHGAGGFAASADAALSASWTVMAFRSGSGA